MRGGDRVQKGELEVQSELNFSICWNALKSVHFLQAASSHECAFACQYLGCMPRAIMVKVEGLRKRERETR